MYPEMMLAMARIAEMERELSEPLLRQRQEARQRAAAARRSRRRLAVSRSARAGWAVVVGRLSGRGTAIE